MSQKDQKNQTKSADKWRDIAEAAESAVDNEHLLDDETSSNKLEDKLNLLEKETEKYKDQVARIQAELENSRRRMEQEVTKAHKFGVERLVSDLVPVMDSLTQALQGTASDDPKVQSLRHGITLTADLLRKTMEKNGITTIDPAVGDAFDPTQHEAMSMQQNPEMASNTIIQVLQKGYALHGRVIRAAMVIVAA